MACLQPRKTEREFTFLEGFREQHEANKNCRDLRARGGKDTYMIKSQFSSDNSWTFPANPVPAVPALFTMLFYIR